jgi:hypothetical protein
MSSVLALLHLPGLGHPHLPHLCHGRATRCHYSA